MLGNFEKPDAERTILRPEDMCGTNDGAMTSMFGSPQNESGAALPSEMSARL
jgi:hypothetical protein